MTHEGFDLYSCADCGAVFMHPLPTVEEVTGIYDDSYDGATAGYFTKVDKKLRRSRHRMRCLSRFVYHRVPYDNYLGKRLMRYGWGA